jgi:pyruvate formate lyase activating enzyme
MKIYGFQKTTLLDYPEHVAATLFTGGCNFRCPFCQNAGLVCGFAESVCVPEEEVFAHLKKRQGILDGVCITGGEPTLQPDLEDFLRRVRDLGYQVKLDSNGYRPEVLRHLLEQGLLDYVAMDIKASRDNYARVAGLQENFSIECIEESIALLQNSGIPYEFRTTAVKGLHTVAEFAEIGRWLAGSRAYFIQSYRDSAEVLNGAGLESFSDAELTEMARLARNFIDRVELRGVE